MYLRGKIETHCYSNSGTQDIRTHILNQTLVSFIMPQCKHIWYK